MIVEGLIELSDIDEALNWLETSPMQRMSLGSKELFHSNFLSWLFETYPDTVKVVFDIDVTVCNVQREKSNLDMLVRDGGEPVLIIENKVKSYPDLAQLLAYNGKFPDVKRRVLLTLVRPDVAPPEPWKLLSYADLATCLRGWFQGAQIGEHDRRYVMDYITLIGHLARIAETFFDPKAMFENGFWFPMATQHASKRKDQLKALAKIGLAQTFQKLEAAVLTDFLMKAVPKAADRDGLPPLVSHAAPVLDGLHIVAASGLNTQTPCVTFGPAKGMTDSKGLRYLIQIQGTQYRRLVHGRPLQAIFASDENAPKAKDEAEKTRRAWHCLTPQSERWLFGRAREKHARHGHVFDLGGLERRTAMRRDLCFYAPDAVYQYVNIAGDGDPETLSPSELSVQMAHDIFLMKELLSL